MDSRTPMTIATLRQEWRAVTVSDLQHVQRRLVGQFEVWMCDYYREVLERFNTYFPGPHALEEVEGCPALQGYDCVAHRPAYMRLQEITWHDETHHVLAIRDWTCPEWRSVHRGRTELYIPR